MKQINGVWRDAKKDPPDGEYKNKTVLIVKANKSGERVINFGAYMFCGPVCQWSTNNGKGEVLYWTPLPEIPEKEA